MNFILDLIFLPINIIGGAIAYIGTMLICFLTDVFKWCFHKLFHREKKQKPQYEYETVVTYETRETRQSDDDFIVVKDRNKVSIQEQLNGTPSIKRDKAQNTTLDLEH